MLKPVLRFLWRKMPKSLRRLTVVAIEPRFTVTVTAVVLDDSDRVLLLDHVFRPGNGWGLPGGFIDVDEQPSKAIARELREEVGLEVEDLRLTHARTVKGVRQVEIIFVARARGPVRVQGVEISAAEWFARDAFPPGLPKAQRETVAAALAAIAERDPEPAA